MNCTIDFTLRLTTSTKIKRRSTREALGYLVVPDALRDLTIIIQRSHLMTFDVFSLNKSSGGLASQNHVE